MLLALFAAIALLGQLTASELATHPVDRRAVEALLIEIRRRLQLLPDEKSQAALKVLPIPADEIEEGSGEGSGEGIGITGVPINAGGLDDFPTPLPVLVSSAELREKENYEKFLLSKMKSSAHEEHKVRLEKDPEATINLLKGLDVHGPSGGYHRALSGGYLPPHTYDPYNVNWFSYGDESDHKKNQAIARFRHVLSSN